MQNTINPSKTQETKHCSTSSRYTRCRIVEIDGNFIIHNIARGAASGVSFAIQLKILPFIFHYSNTFHTRRLGKRGSLRRSLALCSIQWHINRQNNPPSYLYKLKSVFRLIWHCTIVPNCLFPRPQPPLNICQRAFFTANEQLRLFETDTIRGKRNQSELGWAVFCPFRSET